MEEPPAFHIPLLLFQAAKEANTKMVLHLLQKYDSEFIDPETFKWAVTSFSIPMMSALLKRYPLMINHQYDYVGTPLMIACLGTAPLEFLRYLLEAGADPNLVPATVDYTAMQLASTTYGGRIESIKTMKLFRRFGATMDGDVLAWAAFRGQVYVMHYLLGQRVPHERDPIRMRRFIPQQQLALHAAVYQGHNWVVFELLASSVDVNCKNGRNLTAMAIVQEPERRGFSRAQIKFFLGIWQERSLYHDLIYTPV